MADQPLRRHPRALKLGEDRQVGPCATPCASHFVCPAASCTPAAVLTTERAAARQAPNAPQTRQIWLYERKGRDSNPGDRSRGLTVFKTAAFNHSATLPSLSDATTRPSQPLHWHPYS